MLLPIFVNFFISDAQGGNLPPKASAKAQQATQKFDPTMAIGVAYNSMLKQRDALTARGADTAAVNAMISKFEKKNAAALAEFKERGSPVPPQRRAEYTPPTPEERADVQRRYEARKANDPSGLGAVLDVATRIPHMLHFRERADEEYERDAKAKAKAKADAEAKAKAPAKAVAAEAKKNKGKGDEGTTPPPPAAPYDFSKYLQERQNAMSALGITDPTTDIEENLRRREERIDKRRGEQADYNLREGRGIAALRMAEALSHPGQSTAAAFGKAFGVAGEEAGNLRALSQAAMRADEAARDRIEDARIALKQGNYKQFTDSYNEFHKHKNDAAQIEAYMQKAFLDAQTTILAAHVRGAGDGFDVKDLIKLRGDVWSDMSKDPRFQILPETDQQRAVNARVAQIMGQKPPSQFTSAPGAGTPVDMTSGAKK